MSRTYNPLHFEDLDPRRFEDLIRGLAYDLKDWLEIEATGRSGNDKGFDIRAWEKKATADEDNEDVQKTKKWLIQCKREKQIGPKKAKEYAEAVLKENDDLYGVIFVCSSDLSIDARDAIRKVLSEGDIQEVRIWSRAEIEDQLYQPKNDHLLFAFFGFSLTHRKQSVKTAVRARLAAKRKAEKALGSVGGSTYKKVIIRRADDTAYPFAPKGMHKLPMPQWQYVEAIFYEHFYDGIVLIVETFNAYLDREKKEYDIEERHSEFHATNRSSFEGRPQKQLKNSYAVYQFFRSIPDQNRFKYQEIALIPYENIVDIDTSGDDDFHTPQVFVLPYEDGDLIKSSRYPLMKNDAHWPGLWFNKSKYKRVKYFPVRYRQKKEPDTQPPDSATRAAEKPFPDLNK